MVFSSFQSLLNSLSLLKTWCFLSPFIYLYFDFIWALPVHDDQVTWSSQGANGEKLHEDWLATVFPAVANRLHRSKPTMLSFDPHAGNRANKTEKRRKFNTQYWYETLMVWNKLITSWKNYRLEKFGGLSTRCRYKVIQLICHWSRVRFVYRHEVLEMRYIFQGVYTMSYSNQLATCMAYITVFMTVSNYRYTFTFIVLCIITFLKFLKLEH